LANRLCGCQGRKAGGPGSGPRAPIKPGYEPVHIDRGSRRDVLQVRFRQPPISGVPQPKAASALGQRPFNPRALLITLLPFCTSVPCPRSLQRLELRLRMQFQAPGGLRRSRAQCPSATGTTVVLAKPHLDIGATRVVDPLCPAP
jgi:hypothetical protein